MTERPSSWVAAILAFGVIVASMPVAAAELNGANVTLGSVSGAGSVQVRGITVNRESTLFSNDRVRTGSGAYAKLNLSNGSRIELAGDSELVVKSDTRGLQLNLVSGAVTLKASKASVTILVSDLEVRPISDSSVRVTVLENSLADVQVVSGRAELINTTKKESLGIGERGERIVNLKTGKIERTLTQVASIAPPSAPPAGIPAPAPASNNSEVAKTVSSGGGIAAVIAWLATRGPTSGTSPSPSKEQALHDLESLVRAAATATTVVDHVISNAGLIASSSPGDVATANALTNAATSTRTQIVSISTQASQLSTQLNNASTQSQVNLVAAQIGSLMGQLNQQITNLNGEIAQVNPLGLVTITASPINPVEPVIPPASQSAP